MNEKPMRRLTFVLLGWGVWMWVGLPMSLRAANAAQSNGQAVTLQIGASLQVPTEAGVVEGKQVDGVRAFLGVPYAAPPVGQLRWKAPTPIAKWTGVRPAQAFGPRCMQPKLYDDMFFRDAGGSEDCLTLNVWTTAKTSAAKLPVMVWIYGGGFVTGGTSEPRQDGTNLARKNVVIVSMNYRLGIFGFFAYPGLAAESPKGSSAGNYGLLDQVAALQWVQKNIEGFGGDPSNVTIFGESAGSFSVSGLMASPVAKGLFVRAIGESGAAFASATLPYKPLDEREKTDTEFANAVLHASTLEALRAIAADKLLQATMKPNGKDIVDFDPDIDGYFLPESLEAIWEAGKQNDVPLLAGWNHDEGSFAMLAPKKPDMASFKSEAEAKFAAKAADLLKLYPATTDAEAARSAEDLAGDEFIAWSTWKWIEEQTKNGKQPVYRYRFDLAPPPDALKPAALGAFHSAEIEYVFGNLDSRSKVPWRPEDRVLSEKMQSYWTNFAKTGDPNGAGLARWPTYSPASGWQVMYLRAEPAAEKDPVRDRYLFLDGVWGK
jgi:para-nitrobenzyl esterase